MSLDHYYGLELDYSQIFGVLWLIIISSGMTERGTPAVLLH